MEFGPAVVEAAPARVPLVVLTADRPPELRDRGAPQTIDQDHLYGGAAKWFAELPLLDGDPATAAHVRSVAGRAVATARAGPAGPVHLNVPVPRAAAARRAPRGRPSAGTAAPRPRHRRRAAMPAGARSTTPDWATLAGRLEWPARAHRGGPGRRPGAPRRARGARRARRASRSSPTRCPACATGAARPVDGRRARRPARRGAGRGSTPIGPELVDPDRARCRRPSRSSSCSRQRSPSSSSSTATAAGASRRSCRRRSCTPTPRRPCAPSPTRARRPGRADGAWARAWLARRCAPRPTAMAGWLGRLDEPFEGAPFAALGAALPGRRRRSGPATRCPSATWTAGCRRRSGRSRSARTAAPTASTASCPRRSGPRRSAGGPVVLVVGDLSFLHDLNALRRGEAPRPVGDDRAGQQRRRRHLLVPAPGDGDDPGAGLPDRTRSSSGRPTGSTSRRS